MQKKHSISTIVKGFSKLKKPTEKPTEYVAYYRYLHAYHYKNQVIFKYMERGPWTIYYYHPEKLTEKDVSDMGIAEFINMTIWILKYHDDEKDYIVVAPDFTANSIKKWIRSYEECGKFNVKATIIDKNTYIIHPSLKNKYDKPYRGQKG